ncbi:MAG: transporter substrate-binding domain-containing protein [Phycisphaerales bacterium]|nr:transporter substrate-binding domain-containing protein [Phycisphaerales bacterium]
MPMEYLDDDGRARGFQVELIEAVAKEMNFTVQVRLGPWSEIHQQFIDGRIDVVGMFERPERTAYANFTTPHSVAFSEIFTRKGGPLIPTIESLNGSPLTIIVQDKALAAQVLAAMPRPPRMVPVQTETEALKLLASGQHDAAIVTSTGGRWAIRTQQLTNLTTTGAPALGANVSLATRKNDDLLLATLNTGITRLKASGAYDAMYVRWFPEESEQAVHFRRVAIGALIALSVLAVVLAGLWAWNRTLKSRIAQARAEAEAAYFARLTAEAESARLEQEISRAQGVSIIGQLAASAAHDFNNVLMAIGGAAENLQASNTEADRQRSCQYIQRAIDNGRGLTTRLTRLTRVSGAVNDPGTRVDLAAAVRDALPLVERLSGRKVRVITEIEPGPITIASDQSSLQQGLLNLAANARDAMAAGGELRISVQRIGDEAILRVADNGQGMDPDTLSHCVESFFTTKPEGTGLGLASVDALAKRAGGSLLINSQSGRGTIVELKLPIAAPAATSARA